jgi:hypothetical protein
MGLMIIMIMARAFGVQRLRIGKKVARGAGAE